MKPQTLTEEINKIKKILNLNDVSVIEEQVKNVISKFITKADQKVISSIEKKLGKSVGQATDVELANILKTGEMAAIRNSIAKNVYNSEKNKIISILKKYDLTNPTSAKKAYKELSDNGIPRPVRKDVVSLAKNEVPELTLPKKTLPKKKLKSGPVKLSPEIFKNTAYKLVAQNKEKFPGMTKGKRIINVFKNNQIINSAANDAYNEYLKLGGDLNIKTILERLKTLENSLPKKSSNYEKRALADSIKYYSDIINTSGKLTLNITKFGVICAGLYFLYYIFNAIKTGDIGEDVVKAGITVSKGYEQAKKRADEGYYQNTIKGFREFLKDEWKETYTDEVKLVNNESVPQIKIEQSNNIYYVTDDGMRNGKQVYKAVNKLPYIYNEITSKFDKGFKEF